MIAGEAPAREAVHPDAFRAAISTFASGVTVVTSVADETPVGMTASAVSSLSLDPVLLLVCVNTRLATHRTIEQSRRFVVNVLGEGQEGLALRFARPLERRFDGVDVRTVAGLPVLCDAIAYFVCDLHEQYPGGDHSIFTGLVRECGVTQAVRPLVYFRSAFRSIRDPESDREREIALWDAISFGIGT